MRAASREDSDKSVLKGMVISKQITEDDIVDKVMTVGRTRLNHLQHAIQGKSALRLQADDHKECSDHTQAVSLRQVVHSFQMSRVRANPNRRRAQYLRIAWMAALFLHTRCAGDSGTT